MNAATEGETTKALLAIRGAELKCIRYRGTEAAVLERLAGLGEPELADETPHLKPVLRNHVSFDTSAVELSGVQLASRFRDHLLGPTPPERRNTVRPISKFRKSAWLRYAWAAPDFHRVVFRDVGLPDGRWLVTHHSYLAVSDDLNDWLSVDALVTNIRWYSRESWNGSREWRRAPW